MNFKCRFLIIALLAPSLLNAMVYTIEQGDSQALARAITDSNDRPGADVIELAEGVYTLQQQFPSPDGESSLPSVQGTLLIRGNRAELRAYTHRSVHLINVAKSGYLRLQGMTLAEGNNGALINHGKAELDRVTVVDQTTRNAAAIIANFGDIRLTRSELSFNTVSNAGQNAGTIVNYGFAGIRNTQIRGNRVSRRFETLALASVLMNYGKAELREVKLSDNQTWDAVPTLHLQGTAHAFVNQGNGELSLHEVSDLP